MKYTSIDRLQDFEFHDSEFRLIEWIDGILEKLVFSATSLNVHRDALPNHSGVDMEIKKAKISFHNVRILEFEIERFSKEDENGNEYFDEPLTIVKGNEAKALFQNELDNSITVLYLMKTENGEYELNGIGNKFFFVRFIFESVEIEWDEYSNAAWYELKQQHIRKVTLGTPSKDVTCDVHILSQSEFVYDDRSLVRVTLPYEGSDYQGVGSDYLWVDAFVDLQRKLPENVSLKCCLTCRHGNMCPVGNAPGEVFCTKDVVIKSKKDSLYYTDDENERKNRSRFYTDICENYKEQIEEFYTYNDFYSLMKRKN